MNKIKQIFTKKAHEDKKHEKNILLAFLIITFLFSITTDVFFSVSNFLTIINQISMIFIIGVGMTFVIILGGMDLSAGYVAGLAGVITAGCLSKGINIPVSILIGLSIGVLVGVFNGIVITKLKITDFIVTLGTMSITHGIIFTYTQGYPIYKNIPKEFLFIGQGKVLGIPFPIIISAIVFIIGNFILKRLSIGTYIYAVGCNEEAARLSGIRVNKIRIFGYAFSGLMAAIAGIIMTSRLGSGQPTAGDTFLFDAIGATVLGGTSLTGGAGTILGTLIGVGIIGIIGNGLTLLNISYYYQEIVKGAIIILAVAYNSYRAKRLMKQV